MKIKSGDRVKFSLAREAREFCGFLVPAFSMQGVVGTVAAVLEDGYLIVLDGETDPDNYYKPKPGIVPGDTVEVIGP